MDEKKLNIELASAVAEVKKRGLYDEVEKLYANDPLSNPRLLELNGSNDAEYHSFFSTNHTPEKTAELIDLYQRAIVCRLRKNAIDSSFLDLHFAVVLFHVNPGRIEQAASWVNKVFQIRDIVWSRTDLGNLGVRFFQTRNGILTQMGHLINEPDIYRKAQTLGWRTEKREMLLNEDGQAANRAVLKYIREKLCVVTDPRLCRRLRPLQSVYEVDNFWVREPSGKIHLSWDGYIGLQHEWEKRGLPSVFNLTTRDRENGWKFLESLGMPKGSWFVTVHVRKTVDANGKLDPISEHRNAEIESYFPAFDEIRKRGGWIVRLGNPSLKPLEPMPQVIDYAHYPDRKDWIDLFLVAASRFLIGTSSGMFGISIAFNVPSICTNVSAFTGWAVLGKDLFLPKLLWKKDENRYLNFTESMVGPLGRCYNTLQYRAHGVEVQDNSSEDILGSVKEMLTRLELGNPYSAEDEELQKQFKDLVYKTQGLKFCGRLAKDFLAKNRQLM